MHIITELQKETGKKSQIRGFKMSMLFLAVLPVEAIVTLGLRPYE